LLKSTKKELLEKCKELGVKRVSSKKKSHLIACINDNQKVGFLPCNVKKEILKSNFESNDSKSKDCIFSDYVSINSEVVFPSVISLDNVSRISEEVRSNLDNNSFAKRCEEVVEGRLKFIDLFCGIGGFHQALNRIDGTECVFACDIDEKCRNVYEKNYNVKPSGDITKVEIENIPSFDILCGGFPCQSFSNSGKKMGFDDKRGQLYEYILNIAKEKKPSFLFLENVKHIKRIDDGKIFKYIIERINEIGYKVQTVDLSPHQLGIPQQRERVVFVCIRNDIYDEKKELNLTPPSNIAINIEGIIEKDRSKTNKYRISAEDEEILNIWDEMIKKFEVGENLSPTILCNEFNTIYTVNELKNLATWKKDYISKNKPLYKKYKCEWDDWLIKNNEKISKKEVYGKLEWQSGKIKANDSIFNHFIQFRQSGIRVKKSEYFPTLVAIVQTPIYAREKRFITPRECARLQSFPESFIMHENDHTAYKQFGNAVNVDVVYFVMYQTLKTYGRLEKY
jgi:DNA (cytosine-5)-methyltransferase 1